MDGSSKDSEESTDDERGMAQVNFRIDAEQKKEWKDWLDDSKEYSTLTDLIRSSVEAEINRDNIPQGSPAISEDIQRLRSDINRIQRDVRWVRETLQDESDISYTAQALLQELEVLPSLDGSKAPDDPVPREVHAAYQVVNPGGPEDDYHPQTKSALCERVGIREDKFDDAIEHLNDRFLPVIEVDLEGETHYFKEE